MPEILLFDSIAADHALLVGGKGLSLGLMATGGLPVPAGFVITTNAYRRYRYPQIDAHPAFTRTLLEAYRLLDSGLVAVRSSATSEDSADASFAGQQETFLGIEGDDDLIDAVERCWKSLHTERAAAYRARQGVADSGLAMAVVVQKLVHAEVAGVLFTRDPLDLAGERMLAEASWGLGEAVVSGRVTPDRFHLDRVTGRTLDRQLGAKSIRITAQGEEAIPADQQAQFCLDDNALSLLAELGRKVEAFYGEPRDVEWAFTCGTFHLLQARPITVASAAEREQVRQDVIADLKTKADRQGTVWAKYNLSEVLSAPTPMTWAIVSRLLAADGGFGAMYRDLGMKPDPTLGSQSAFDLVAGRPMVNLSRLPRMQSPMPIFEYPFAAMKKEPNKALDPVPVLNPLRYGVLRGLLRIPSWMIEMSRNAAEMKKAQVGFAEEFHEATTNSAAPARGELEADWSQLDLPSLATQVHVWSTLTLVNLAATSLKPTVFAQQSWTALVRLLTPKLGEERARIAVGELSLGARPPQEADLAGSIEALATGQMDRSTFLERFGHRGPNEMELSQPRWSETPKEIDRIIAMNAHGSHAPGRVRDWEAIANEAKLPAAQRMQGAALVRDMRLFFGLREAGKHYLLMGYAVIRRALVELDRKLGLKGGIFYLTPDDFPALLKGEDLTAKIAAARKRRQAELSLEVPPVLFSDDLDAIGRPAPDLPGRDKYTGVALSAGVAEGPALVLTEPTAALDREGYILVCPSTDPAWVPLFVRAKGLVMETGGVLSHGAIVAREFGLPAIAGLPGLTRQLRTGQILRVDGGRGTVTVLDSVH